MHAGGIGLEGNGGGGAQYEGEGVAVEEHGADFARGGVGLVGEHGHARAAFAHGNEHVDDAGIGAGAAGEALGVGFAHAGILQSSTCCGVTVPGGSERRTRLPTPSPTLVR